MQDTSKQELKEQLFTLSFSKEEILERIRNLSNSENVTLYLKVQKGAQEADELNKLMQLVEPYMKK
jgi:DNA-binding MltR family transcriptional regulator